MQNNLSIFNFQDNQVRTVLEKEEIFFNLKDICKVLGIRKSENVTPRLNPKGTRKIGTLTKGGKQSMTNNIQLFQFDNHKVRILTINNYPLLFLTTNLFL